MSSIKHRHLGVKSSHRSALLRNLVTSLIDQETIRTTWPRAKEAQRVAEKLITLGKKNTNASRQKAQGTLFLPEKYLPKLFGPLRERYADRPGGYTRVLRTEPLDRDTKHKPTDREYNPGQPESAILELVDGPKDMRFAITARALVRQQEMEELEPGSSSGMREILAANARKVTRFRENGWEQLDQEVNRVRRKKRHDKRNGRGGDSEDDDDEDDGEEEEEEEEEEKVLERTSQGHALMKRSRR